MPKMALIIGRGAAVLFLGYVVAWGIGLCRISLPLDEISVLSRGDESVSMSLSRSPGRYHVSRLTTLSVCLPWREV